MRAQGMLFAAVFALAGCAMQQSGTGWTTLIDGTKGLDNFTRVNEANWSAKDGAIEATAGGKDPAYLLTKNSYGNFTIRAEFWASDDANSGIFIRCQDRNNVGDETCYEANIFDQRPDQTYATGAIVKVAPVKGPQPKAGGKWNVMEFTANGPQLTVMLNGVTTVDVRDTKFASGPIGLQWGRGTIKWRKVEVKTL
jgi:3-keto-disaccharide hydrolase